MAVAVSLCQPSLCLAPMVALRRAEAAIGLLHPRRGRGSQGRTGAHGEDDSVGTQGEDDVAGVHGEEDGAAEPRPRGARMARTMVRARQGGRAAAVFRLDFS